MTDEGTPVFLLLPPDAQSFDVFLYSIDANLKYRGLTLLGEYYLRWLTDFDGAPVDELFDHGFMLQAGYFVCREKLELLARWSREVGDSGNLGGSDQSADEVAAGIAWYIRGHNLKFVFDATT